MPPKLLADHTLYHLSPKGFWKKFRDNVVINPEISSGLPLASVNRFPPPASRPEIQATPATRASDPAQNPYFKRDSRRKYPQLSVVTQSTLSQLLLGIPEQPSVSAPADGEKSGVPTASTPGSEAPSIKDLTEAISSLTSAKFSASNPPPTPPTVNTWRPIRVADAPHASGSYFPMRMFGDSPKP